MNKTQKELSTNGLKPKIVKMEGEALYKHLQLYFGKSPKEALECMIENNQDISFTESKCLTPPNIGRDR